MCIPRWPKGHKYTAKEILQGGEKKKRWEQANTQQTKYKNHLAVVVLKSNLSTGTG